MPFNRCISSPYCICAPPPKHHWSDLLRKGDLVSISRHSSTISGKESSRRTTGEFVGYALINKKENTTTPSSPSSTSEDKTGLISTTTPHHHQHHHHHHQEEEEEEDSSGVSCEVVGVVCVEVGYDDMIPLCTISKSNK